ncbi:hypothetical protein RRG08_026825 [Elysia crispata]|uniref:Uncharacterized protein n=1 Tax=Elysia crispata TaxID=231223 RepID=A0AAE0ZI10_9GAST|nr:hypothetical protein RRG08_026825 [Elysia crispata]
MHDVRFGDQKPGVKDQTMRMKRDMGNKDEEDQDCEDEEGHGYNDEEDQDCEDEEGHGLQGCGRPGP